MSGWNQVATHHLKQEIVQITHTQPIAHTIINKNEMEDARPYPQIGSQDDSFGKRKAKKFRGRPRTTIVTTSTTGLSSRPAKHVS